VSEGRPTEIGRWTVALAAVLLLSLAGCTFEERGNGNASAPSGAEAPEGEARDGRVDPAAAALDVVRTFREATAVGDLSLALALTDRDATFADELAGRLDPGHTRGELLLELRRRLAREGGLREEASEVILGEGLAVVVSRLELGGHADFEGGTGGTIHETVVLVPVAEGWRIRHLHRSVPTSH
jgi:hypothetical protein